MHTDGDVKNDRVGVMVRVRIRCSVRQSPHLCSQRHLVVGLSGSHFMSGVRSRRTLTLPLTLTLTLALTLTLIGSCRSTIKTQVASDACHMGIGSMSDRALQYSSLHPRRSSGMHVPGGYPLVSDVWWACLNAR